MRERKQNGGVGNSQRQGQASESYLRTLQQRTDNMKVIVFDIIATKVYCELNVPYAAAAEGKFFFNSFHCKK